MNKTVLSLSGVVLLSAASASAQYSAYLPGKSQFVVTPTYVFSTYDSFWAGDQKVKLQAATGAKEQNQHTGSIGLEYGMCEVFALDATLGYTAAIFSGGSEDSGLSDTTLGVRWNFVDERKINCPYMPTMSLRLGGIIRGTYDPKFPFSAGDGASGFESSLLFGKAICPGFGLYGDIGWRIRTHDVPQDLFGSVGAYATSHGFTLSAGYRHVQGLSGPDIGGPGFMTTYGFPQVKEINQLVEAGLGYRDSGGRYYQVFGAFSVDGRNTGDKTVIGGSISFPF